MKNWLSKTLLFERIIEVGTKEEGHGKLYVYSNTVLRSSYSSPSVCLLLYRQDLQHAYRISIENMQENEPIRSNRYRWNVDIKMGHGVIGFEKLD